MLLKRVTVNGLDSGKFVFATVKSVPSTSRFEDGGWRPGMTRLSRRSISTRGVQPMKTWPVSFAVLAVIATASFAGAARADAFATCAQTLASAGKKVARHSCFLRCSKEVRGVCVNWTRDCPIHGPLPGGGAVRG